MASHPPGRLPEERGAAVVRAGLWLCAYDPLLSEGREGPAV
jgi:hypothetical protein